MIVAAGAVDPGREVAEQPARVVDDDDRKPAGRGDVGARGIRHDRDGALLGGGRRELRAVAVGAADGDEDVSRAQIGGREGEPGEGHAGGVAADVDAESGGEVVERVDGGRVRAEHGGQVRGRVGRHGASILSSAPVRAAAKAAATRRSQVTANSKPGAGTVAVWK